MEMQLFFRTDSLRLNQTRVLHQVFMLFCCIAITVSVDEEESNYQAGAVE